LETLIAPGCVSLNEHTATHVSSRWLPAAQSAAIGRDHQITDSDVPAVPEMHGGHITPGIDRGPGVAGARRRLVTGKDNGRIRGSRESVKRQLALKRLATRQQHAVAGLQPGRVRPFERSPRRLQGRPREGIIPRAGMNIVRRRVSRRAGQQQTAHDQRQAGPA